MPVITTHKRFMGINFIRAALPDGRKLTVICTGKRMIAAKYVEDGYAE